MKISKKVNNFFKEAKNFKNEAIHEAINMINEVKSKLDLLSYQFIMKGNQYK